MQTRELSLSGEAAQMHDLWEETWGVAAQTHGFPRSIMATWGVVAEKMVLAGKMPAAVMAGNLAWEVALVAGVPYLDG